MSNLTDYYITEFKKRGFTSVTDTYDYCESGSVWKLDESIGGGSFWLYTQPELFHISIHDFYFREDTILEFSWPECLSIMLYDSIAGEELNPYQRLEAGSIQSFIGRNESYKILIHRKVPVRSIGVEIMPGYYESYLKEKYPGEYINPKEAFQSIGQTMKFPEMNTLLRQIMTYRGQGLPARLFYEGKVTEAVSLIVERLKSTSHDKTRKKLPVQDIQMLECLILYLNDHCMDQISMSQLSKVSCMGLRKLQTVFKDHYGCTITEYIQQRRMSQAESLLSNTDMSISQVASGVGYHSASRFSELFRKSTGISPHEYRKMRR